MNTLLSVFVDRLGWTLLHFVWQGAVIAALFALVMIPLRQMSAHVRYLIACGFFVALATSPLATWFLMEETNSMQRVTMSSAMPLAIPATLSPEDSLPADVMDARQTPSQNAAIATQNGSLGDEASQSHWLRELKFSLEPSIPYAVALWFCGVLILSVRLLFGWHWVERLRRKATSPVAPVLKQRMQQLAQRLRVSRPVEIVESALIEVPTVIGWLRPLILIPSSALTGLSASQLEAIIAHELAHIRRHDFLVNLVQSVIETLLFYHPAVWWISHRIRDERENCCDDIAVSVCGNRIEYARALAEMESLRPHSAVVMAASGGSLLQRIRRLVLPNSELSRASNGTASLVGLLALLIAILPYLMSIAASADNEHLENFVAKLPNGIEVELAGVGFHPSTDHDWWRPNGGPLIERPQPPGTFTILANSPKQSQCREFFVKIRGLSKEHAVTTDFGGISNASTSEYANGLWIGYQGAGPFNSKTTSIRIGLSTEAFGPSQTIDITGTKQSDGEIPDELTRLYDLFVPLHAVQSEGETKLLVQDSSFNELRGKVEWDLNAIDTDGNKLRYSSQSVPPLGPRAFSFELTLARIARFEFRLRPYRQWVTFENVALAPGMNTDVKVKVEALPIPIVAKFSDGKSIEFVGITRNTALANDGWRPDGLPIGDVGYWPSTIVLTPPNTVSAYREKGHHDEPLADAIDLLFRFRGLTEQPSIHFNLHSTMMGSSIRPLVNPYDLRVSVLKPTADVRPGIRHDIPVDTIVVALTDEPWGRYVKVGLDGNVIDPIQPEEMYAATYGLIQVLGAQPTDRTVTGSSILLQMPSLYTDPDNRWHKFAFEFRAIDTDGHQHRADSFLSISSEQEKLETHFSLSEKLPDGKTLSHYEYRLRPYRHWATFENVSFQSGKQMSVKIATQTYIEPRQQPDAMGDDLQTAKLVSDYPNITKVTTATRSKIEFRIAASNPANGMASAAPEDWKNRNYRVGQAPIELNQDKGFVWYGITTSHQFLPFPFVHRTNPRDRASNQFLFSDLPDQCMLSDGSWNMLHAEVELGRRFWFTDESWRYAINIRLDEAGTKRFAALATKAGSLVALIVNGKWVGNVYLDKLDNRVRTFRVYAQDWANELAGQINGLPPDPLAFPISGYQTIQTSQNVFDKELPALAKKAGLNLKLDIDGLKSAGVQFDRRVSTFWYNKSLRWGIAKLLDASNVPLDFRLSENGQDLIVFVVPQEGLNGGHGEKTAVREDIIKAIKDQHIMFESGLLTTTTELTQYMQLTEQGVVAIAPTDLKLGARVRYQRREGITIKICQL